MATDFGPVPASQVKKESTGIFDALEQGRRVLISRYGKVVAAIDPASRHRYEALLAAYAVPGFDDTHELTATDISQEGPAEHIRAAENGSAALVTKNQKVYGVLQRFIVEPGAGTPLSDPDVQEQLLARFEEEHPDASPAEFAAEVERISEPMPASWGALEPGFTGPQYHAAWPVVDDADIDIRAWVDGMAIRGFAYEQSGDIVAARNVLDVALKRVGGTTDDRLRRRVREMMLKSAHFHAIEGDTQTALKLAEAVTAELDPVSRHVPQRTAVIPDQPAKYEHA